jgi:uncharacterized protein YlxW (UPF0749 family)
VPDVTQPQEHPGGDSGVDRSTPEVASAERTTQDTGSDTRSDTRSDTGSDTGSDTAPEAGPDSRSDLAADEEAPGSPELRQERAESSRRRLLQSGLHPSRSQVVVGVLLAALGFAAVTQVRSNELDNTYASYREQDLVDVLSTLTEATQRAQSELARLESTRRDLLSDNDRRTAALSQAEQAADSLEILAGQVPVTGPGIRIVVTETDGSVEVGSILDTVQELRTAGAEAMEFNDEVRIVAQSSFTDAVGGLMVDGTLLTSPYVIDVIGEPRTLQGAMSFVQGPTDQLEADGASVDVLVPDSVDIESVRPAGRAEYAQPAPAQ